MAIFEGARVVEFVTTVTQDSHRKIPVPRLAFLGFCERAETITEGHAVFWKSNVLGVSHSRAFYVCPANLRGMTVALGIFQPTSRREFQVSISRLKDKHRSKLFSESRVPFRQLDGYRKAKCVLSWREHSVRVITEPTERFVSQKPSEERILVAEGRGQS
jgi:hypothetical protein